MNTLLIQDSFEPYYAGRAGFAAPEPSKRPRPPEKARADNRPGEVPEADRKPDRPEH